MNDHDVVQKNTKPTRLDANLDLLFATNPDLVKKLDVCQGMSDHMILLSDIQVNVRLARKKARKIYIYRKGNMENLKDDMTKLLSEFQGDQSVEELWNIFTSKLLSSIKKNMPSKMISERWNIPWMTNTVRRMIRKKQRLYNKAKRTGREEDWKVFKSLTKAIKAKLAKAHNEYVLGLLDIKESDDEIVQSYSVSKKLWSYIRSKRKDVIGVGVLRKRRKRYYQL